MRKGVQLVEHSCQHALPIQFLPGTASIRSRPGSGSHPTVVPMAVGKTAFILNYRPDFFVSELVAESDHGSPRHPILDHPEEFSLRPVTPKAVMVEISWGGIQRCRERAIACSTLTMTIEASSPALIERSPLRASLRRVPQGVDQSSRFGQLVVWDPRLHDVLLGSSRE